MRHAKQSGLAERDHERPLTDEGRDDAQRVGLDLATTGWVPDGVLSSTALRCRQTWQAVEVGLGVSVEADFDPELYNASSHGLLDVLAGADEDRDTLLLLAHNPGISMLALELGGADDATVDRLRSGFSPATTACFEIDGPWSTLSRRTATLKRFEPPPRG